MAKRLGSPFLAHVIRRRFCSQQLFNSSCAPFSHPLATTYVLSSSSRISLHPSWIGGTAHRTFATQKNTEPSQSKWDPEQEAEPEGDTPYLVYDGALKRQLKHIKLFSLATSLGGLPLQPVIYSRAPEHGMAATIAMLTMIGFFTYVTPFLIHQLAKKYVTEINYDPKTQMYTAVTYNFFLIPKKVGEYAKKMY